MLLPPFATSDACHTPVPDSARRWRMGNSQDWREDLRWLVWSLVPYGSEQDETPAEAIDHLCTLLAVAAATLRQDTQVTGGTERDANAWQEASWLIALANPALTGALMLPATQAHARVASAAEVADTIALAAAADQDPYAAARADPETSGYDLVRDEGIWIVEGSFSNPVRAAGRAATTLGSANQSNAAVLVRNGNRSTLLLWAQPYMAIADSRTQTWHMYTLSAAASPQSRTADCQPEQASADGSPHLIPSSKSLVPSGPICPMPKASYTLDDHRASMRDPGPLALFMFAGGSSS